jgi:hypothetical protein
MNGCCTAPIISKIPNNTCLNEILINNTTVSPVECENTKMQINKEFWLQLLAPNTWMYTFPEKHMIKIICQSKYTNQIFLQNSGILKINHDCIIHTDTVILHSQPKQGNLTVKTNFLKFEFSDKTEEKIHKKSITENPIILVIFSQHNLGLIEKGIEQLPEVHLKNLKKHTKINYTLNGVIFSILIIFIVVWKGKQCINYFKLTIQRKKCNENHEIKLNTVSSDINEISEIEIVMVEPRKNELVNTINIPTPVTRTTTYTY